MHRRSLLMLAKFVSTLSGVWRHSPGRSPGNSIVTIILSDGKSNPTDKKGIIWLFLIPNPSVRRSSSTMRKSAKPLLMRKQISTNIELINSLLEKAAPKRSGNGVTCAGLTHREASVLLACDIPEVTERLYKLANITILFP